MLKFLKTKTAKIGGLVVAMAMVAAGSASAITQAEATAIITALNLTGSQAAVIQALVSGGSMTSGSYDLGTATLRVGSSGMYVKNLQMFLGITADGAYGPMTAGAVKSWQSSNGLVADGVVGPNTRGAMNASMSSSSTGNGSTGNTGSTGSSSANLSGNVGSIVLTASGDYSSETVGEGENDVEVMAVKMEAGSDSDIEVTSVKVEMIQNQSGISRKPWDYMEEVSVWYKGEKVGSADADEFTKSGNYYSKTIVLDGVVVKAEAEEDLVFAVSALSSLDSGDYGTDDWDIDLINVRFVDGDGVVTTESADAASTANGTYYKSFDFGSFASASNAELTVTAESDAINDVHVLDVDDSNDTSHAITSFLMDASGDSDVWIDEVPAVIQTTGQTSEDLIVISAWIEVDGERISDKEDVPDGGAVTFDDLDYTLSAGDSEEWVLWVELQDVDGALDDGDTVQGTITTASIVAEDEAGDSLTATGASVSGGAHVAFDNGIELTGFTQSVKEFTIDGVNNDRVELTMTFDVHNFGETTLYIPNVKTLTSNTTGSTTTAPSTSEGIGYHVQSSGSVTPGSNDISATLTESDSDLDLENNSYRLKAGKTGTFNLKVTVSTDSNPSIDNVGFRAFLSGVNWATSDSATGANVYTYNLSDYHTDYATLAD